MSSKTTESVTIEEYNQTIQDVNNLYGNEEYSDAVELLEKLYVRCKNSDKLDSNIDISHIEHKLGLTYGILENYKSIEFLDKSIYNIDQTAHDWIDTYLGRAFNTCLVRIDTFGLVDSDRTLKILSSFMNYIENGGRLAEDVLSNLMRWSSYCGSSNLLLNILNYRLSINDAIYKDPNEFCGTIWYLNMSCQIIPALDLILNYQTSHDIKKLDNDSYSVLLCIKASCLSKLNIKSKKILKCYEELIDLEDNNDDINDNISVECVAFVGGRFEKYYRILEYSLKISDMILFNKYFNELISKYGDNWREECIKYWDFCLIYNYYLLYNNKLNDQFLKNDKFNLFKISEKLLKEKLNKYPYYEDDHHIYEYYYWLGNYYLNIEKNYQKALDMYKICIQKYSKGNSHIFIDVLYNLSKTHKIIGNYNIYAKILTDINDICPFYNNINNIYYKYIIEYWTKHDDINYKWVNQLNNVIIKYIISDIKRFNKL